MVVQHFLYVIAAAVGLRATAAGETETRRYSSGCQQGIPHLLAVEGEPKRRIEAAAA